MVKPNVLVLTGYGINCDEETQYAFEKAGAKANIVHINDIIDRKKKIGDYQIFMLPGGFSYGDDLRAGVALANRIRNNLWEELREFIAQDKLVLGICNGFQVLTNLGLLPALNEKYGSRQAALLHNTSARYIDRWVDIRFENSGPWTTGIRTMRAPIAHGEGRFYSEPVALRRLNEKNMICARYVYGEMCEHFSLPANPNGSIEDIAGITDESQRILGLMPHPERAIDFTHLPNWTLIKETYRRKGRELPLEGDGLQLFKNGVRYFS